MTNGDHWYTLHVMADEEPIAISIAETCKRLGVSTNTVHRYIREEGLPAVQIGGPKSRWLIPVEALRSWLEQRSTAA